MARCGAEPNAETLQPHAPSEVDSSESSAQGQSAKAGVAGGWVKEAELGSVVASTWPLSPTTEHRLPWRPLRCRASRSLALLSAGCRVSPAPWPLPAPSLVPAPCCAPPLSGNGDGHLGSLVHWVGSSRVAVAQRRRSASYPSAAASQLRLRGSQSSSAREGAGSEFHGAPGSPRPRQQLSPDIPLLQPAWPVT